MRQASDPYCPRGSATTAAVATLALLAVLFFLAWRPALPPAPLPANAPADQFSAMRALDKLRAMAAQPHSLGSPEHDRVRDDLTGELRSLGLDPQVQTTSVVRTDPKWHGRAVGAMVSNIVARLPGTANTRPLMLVAHYDSVPSGPGASDDGAGTVALLETLRALRSGGALRNDVIFLITDGEEEGLLGAQAFVNEHPWAREAGVVLNFDNRGACGPASMFETSAGNGWLVRELARAAPYPLASSFFYEAYKNLPNDTDLTVFKHAGLAGLNFAYCGCFPRYHTMGDSIRNLDPRSLQHEGSYALSLARHFGAIDLTHPTAPDAVYFNVGHWLLHYPLSWSLPLFVVALLLAAYVFAKGFARGRLRLGAVAAGFAGWLLAAAIAAGACDVLWTFLRGTRFVSLLPYGMAYNGDLYAWGFVALTVAIMAAAYAVLFGGFAIESLALGSLLWWLLLGGFLTIRAPGASYLMVLPLIVSLAELAWAFSRQHEPDPDSVILWTLPAVVGVLVAGALPYVLVMMLSTQVIPALAIMAALLTGFLVPQLHILARPARWWIAVTAALAAAILIGAGMVSAGYSATRQRADSIFYFLDEGEGPSAAQARWMSTEPEADSWSKQFLKPPIEKGSWTELGFERGTLATSVAPILDLPGPTLATVADGIENGNRNLDLQLHFAAGTQLIWLSVKDAHVLGAAVEGKAITGFSPASSGGNAARQDRDADRDAGWLLMYAAPPAAGLHLQLQLEAGHDPVVRVFQDTGGLPAVPGFDPEPRPADAMPTPIWPPLDSSTVVARTFRHFEAGSGK